MDQLAADAQKPRIGVDRDVDRPILVALLGRIGEMLAAVLDPFDRAPEELGGGDHRNVLRIYAKLGAETAADIRRRHAQPALVEIEQRGQRLEKIVRLLGRGPHRHHVIAPLRENAAAFDRMRGAAVLPELFVEDMRGLVEGRLGIAKGNLVGGGDIGVELAPDRGCGGRNRRAAIRDGGKHVVVDGDERGRVLRDIAVDGENERDGLADIGCLAVGERE